MKAGSVKFKGNTVDGEKGLHLHRVNNGILAFTDRAVYFYDKKKNDGKWRTLARFKI